MILNRRMSVICVDSPYGKIFYGKILEDRFDPQRFDFLKWVFLKKTLDRYEAPIKISWWNFGQFPRYSEIFVSGHTLVDIHTYTQSNMNNLVMDMVLIFIRFIWKSIFSKINISGTSGPILMIQKANMIVLLWRIREKYFFGLWTKGGEVEKFTYI